MILRAAVWSLLGLTVVACGGTRNPFETQAPVLEIRDVQAFALNTVFENHEPPSTVFPEVARPQSVCLGMGRTGIRSNLQWLTQVPRETTWDPDRALRGRLESAPARIVPISQCRKQGDFREVIADAGTPTVTFFVSDPTWTTPDIADVRVSIFGLGRYTMHYSLALRKRRGEWTVRRFTCLWAGHQCENFR
jgi:hypothetical protein